MFCSLIPMCCHWLFKIERQITKRPTACQSTVVSVYHTKNQTLDRNAIKQMTNASRTDSLVVYKRRSQESPGFRGERKTWLMYMPHHNKR